MYIYISIYIYIYVYIYIYLFIYLTLLLQNIWTFYRFFLSNIMPMLVTCKLVSTFREIEARSCRPKHVSCETTVTLG